MCLSPPSSFPVTFFLLLLLPPYQPLHITPHTKNKTKNQTASCHRMPWLWQTAESHHEISADSLKACKVPITQAFHLYRKTHRGWIWLSVKVLMRRCILNAADSPPAKGLGHVPGAGQGPGTQPRSALGQDGAPDAESLRAPSPDQAARRLRQYSFSSFAIGPFHLYLQVTHFMS